jgi:hypothetical protein
MPSEKFVSEMMNWGSETERDKILSLLTEDEIRALANHYDLEADKAKEYANQCANKRDLWRRRLSLVTEGEHLSDVALAALEGS